MSLIPKLRFEADEVADEDDGCTPSSLVRSLPPRLPPAPLLPVAEEEEDHLPDGRQRPPEEEEADEEEVEEEDEEETAPSIAIS